MNFGTNHAPGAVSIAGIFNLQSIALPLCTGCPLNYLLGDRDATGGVIHTSVKPGHAMLSTSAGSVIIISTPSITYVLRILPSKGQGRCVRESMRFNSRFTW